MIKNNLDQNELALLWLHSFSLGEKKRDAFLGLFGEPKEIFSSLESKKELAKAIVGDKVLSKMSRPESTAKEMLNQLNKLNICAISRISPQYPVFLREIPNSPLVIFAVGNLALLKETAVAVVGTRKPTAYGKEVAKSFSSELARAGVVLISGLAYGIDSIAHMAALEEGNGKTIAVMAGGLDEIYPAAHTMLARQIVNTGGLLISEYFTGVRPTSYSFPERNRIISGLSNGVLVIEAGENSGSLHTVSHAIEQGKELFIVPANVNSVASFGSNQVLVEMPHALVTAPSQILERLGINADVSVRKVKLSKEEKTIYNLVLRQPLSFDELAQKSKINASTLNSLLTIMEMNEIIKRLPGNEIAANATMEIE